MRPACRNIIGMPIIPGLSPEGLPSLCGRLEFVDTKEGIVLPELNELFEKVGFPRRDPAKLIIALENTHSLVWVRSTKQSRLAKLGQMVGIARATSDGVLSATIWDVAVQPAWQRSGLGRAMMERLTRRLVEAGIPTIALYAEPSVVGLYEKLGECGTCSGHCTILSYLSITEHVDSSQIKITTASARIQVL